MSDGSLCFPVEPDRAFIGKQRDQQHGGCSVFNVALAWWRPELSVTWKNEMALGPKYFLLLYNVAGFGPSQGRRYRVVQPTSHRQWLTGIESCTWGDFSETRINSNTVLEVCARRPLLSSKFDTTTADSCRQACHPLITPRFKKKNPLGPSPL